MYIFTNISGPIMACAYNVIVIEWNVVYTSWPVCSSLVYGLVSVSVLTNNSPSQIVQTVTCFVFLESHQPSTLAVTSTD